MKQNFIHREVEEELNSRTAHRRNVRRALRVHSPLDEQPLKRGRKPCGEADKRNCEHYINRKRNCNIGAGIKSFLLVNKEGDYLCEDIRYIKRDKISESVFFKSVGRKNPKLIRVGYYLFYLRKQQLS